MSRFKFPARAKRIEGGRSTGKTTQCATAVMNGLIKRQNVLVILPTPRMQDVFVAMLHDVADAAGLSEMKYFGMDVFVLQMSQWAPPKEKKVYDLIVFVDGPDDDGNPQFHGHEYVFNLQQNLWAVFDYHASYFQFADGGRPEFLIACNEWNLVREKAQIWIEEFNRLQRDGEPLAILGRLMDIRGLEPAVAGIVAAKIKISAV